MLAENEKAPPEVLRTVRGILDSPAWELNGHPQAAFVQPPLDPASDCGSVNTNTNPSGSNPTTNANVNINTNQHGIPPPPAAIEEISVDALQPLFKAIPYASKGGKEGSRGGTDKYECLWGGCGKIVKRRDHMVNHVKAHLGIKPFACPFVYEYLDQRQWCVRFLVFLRPMGLGLARVHCVGRYLSHLPSWRGCGFSSVGFQNVQRIACLAPCK